MLFLYEKSKNMFLFHDAFVALLSLLMWSLQEVQHNKESFHGTEKNVLVLWLLHTPVDHMPIRKL